MKKLSLITILSANILFAGNQLPQEEVLEEIFIGSSFHCNGLKCIAGETRIEDARSNSVLKEAVVDFEFIPKGILYNRDEIIKISTDRCKDKLDIGSCIDESIAIEKYERGRKVMSSIKSISLNDLTIRYNNSDKIIKIKNLFLSKKAKEIVKKDKISINIEDILLDTKIKIVGLTVDKNSILTNLDKTISSFDSNVPNFNNNFDKNKQRDQFKRILVMYKSILLEFFKNNEISEDLDISFKSQKDGRDLKIVMNLSSDAKNAEKFSLELVFKVNNIEQTLMNFNSINKVQNPNPFASYLMLLGQNILFESLKINNDMTNLVNIHKHILSSNPEYKSNYSLILKKQKEIEPGLNALYKYILNTIILKSNISSLDIKNKDQLPLMLLFMSSNGKNLENVLQIKSETK